MTDKTWRPAEQKTVLFYEDEITAVRLDTGDVLIPLRPIVDGLGLDWSAQRQRINRDPVLADVQGVVVITTPGGQQEMLALPLRFISGFLFGVNASRVKPEIRERIIRYQRECYDVLAEAFAEGRLTADPSFDDLLASDNPAAIAYKTAHAVMMLARQQLIMDGRVSAVEDRLEAIETTLGDPGHHITPDQAMQISQAVKTVALKLSKSTGRNEYGGVYGELYRRYGITSYKELPAAKYEDAMSWLNEWRNSTEGDLPF